VIEAGPDTVLSIKPWALELIEELGLGDRVIGTREGDTTIRILHRGRLVALPEGLRLAPTRLGPWLRSPLLSWRGKLRCAAERFVPARRGGDDESVADFVRRRLGAEVLERIAEPLLAHVHVADVERMSLRATYPQLAALERRYGSLGRGLRAMAAATRPGTVFRSLRGGMGELADALVATLPPESRILGRRAVGLERTENVYRVVLDDGTRFEAADVVLATPAWAAAELAESLAPGLALGLRTIRYAGIATVSLAYRTEDVGDALGGFGFFVPRAENRPILAGTWTSNKLADRTRPGHALLRVFLGGARHEALLELDEDVLVERVRGELERMLGWRAEPVHSRLFRWRRGYPQYDVGHLTRVEAIEAELPEGLWLTGSGYHGVGLPDCVRHARSVAASILERPSRGAERPRGRAPVG